MKTPPESGEIKRVARENEHKAVVAIPDILGVVVVRVEPQVAVIVFHVEHVETAIRVGNI